MRQWPYLIISGSLQEAIPQTTAKQDLLNLVCDLVGKPISKPLHQPDDWPRQQAQESVTRVHSLSDDHPQREIPWPPFSPRGGGD